METVENARGIRALNEKIEDLESAERKLKAEVWYFGLVKLVRSPAFLQCVYVSLQLVDLIESSKHASVLEEKVYQVQRKLQASEEKNAHAQKRIVSCCHYLIFYLFLFYFNRERAAGKLHGAGGVPEAVPRILRTDRERLTEYVSAVAVVCEMKSSHSFF